MLDEPSLRQLTQLLHRQERHVAELPADARPQQPFDDLGALPIRLREVRELTVMPPLDQPARDGYVEVTDEGDPYLTDELYVNGDENHVPTDPEEQKHFFHGLMDAELCAAELMARNSHEHPEMPWDFHVDMARQCWDEIRHAEVHDALMATELDCHWGDYPIGFGYFKSVYAYDLLGRLVLFNGTSEQKAMWRHSHRRKVLIELGQDEGRARVRLPAGRRGPARAQRQALGHLPARRRRGRLPREAARAARRARRHGPAGRELRHGAERRRPPRRRRAPHTPASVDLGRGRAGRRCRTSRWPCSTC